MHTKSERKLLVINSTLLQASRLRNLPTGNPWWPTC